MRSEVQGFVAVVGSAALAYTAGLFAIAIARRIDFLDRPTGYKNHRSPTPYLGGAAVLAAFVLVLVAVTGIASRVAPLLGCAAVLALIGAADDKWTVAPKWRVVAEVLAGAVLWSNHLGFTVSSLWLVNLGLTVIWVIGVVNAFNLSDNMDGACATLTATSAAGVAALAFLGGNAVLAVTALALMGACLGFLPLNLRRPARIFLGDGGSMPLGFLVAALALAATRGRGLGVNEVIACALLAGLPMLDTALVIVSRRRRGVSYLTGGRDHLTHRLLRPLRAPSRVCFGLLLGQAALAALAIVSAQEGEVAGWVCGLGAAVIGASAIAMLESSWWTQHFSPPGTRREMPGVATLSFPSRAGSSPPEPRVSRSRLTAQETASVD